MILDRKIGKILVLVLFVSISFAEGSDKSEITASPI